MTRIGSLFSGYGGLDLAVMDVIPGSSVAWHVEFDKAPAAILAHHWPDVPNHHDVTTVDWATVEPVDIIIGGFPCQDLSHAGKRAGLRPGTRSGLWSHMAYAVSVLRPRLVVIENVLGILSARAAGDVEPCPLCLGDDTADAVRALGAVCADLATLGYDARWTTLRAADAGACHGRARVFIVAHPDNVGGDGRESVPWGGADLRTIIGTVADADSGRREQRDARERDVQLPDATSANALGLLPTPISSDANGTSPAVTAKRLSRGQAQIGDIVGLLPTPTTQETHSGPSQAQRNTPPLNSVMTGLFPTPVAGDGTKASTNPATSQRRIDDGRQPFLTDIIQTTTDFGPYADAIRRHEVALGRPAPAPTEPGKNGPRLSPAFVEFMMMLPAGHVTDPAIGLSRSQQLKALGNGVVPAQAALALRSLLGLSPLSVEGSPDLLGTPTVAMAPRSEAFRSRNPNPAELVAMLPTPTSQSAKHGSLAPVERAGNRPQDDSNLWVVAARMGEQLLPTPRASDGPNGGPGQRNGRGDADTLSAISALLPTPVVNDMGDGKTPPPVGRVDH